MLNAPAIQTDASLNANIEPISNATKQLSGQVARAKIVDQDSLSKGGDLYKIISNHLNKSEDARDFLVRPLNEHVKSINDKFRPNKDALTALKKTMKDKLDVYVAAEQKRLNDEAEAKLKAAEDEALQRAAEAEAEGNAELAENIVETAAEAPVERRRGVMARGGLGSSTSARKNWTFEVTDPAALVRAWLKNEVDSQAVSINESFLQRMAVNLKDKANIPGVRVYQKVSAGVR